jgi:hypothetical protein
MLKVLGTWVSEITIGCWLSLLISSIFITLVTVEFETKWHLARHIHADEYVSATRQYNFGPDQPLPQVHDRGPKRRRPIGAKRACAARGSVSFVTYARSAL